MKTINNDQNLIIAISTVDDGNMADISNRPSFLLANDIIPEETTRIILDYTGDNFCKYFDVTDKYRGKGILDADMIPADGLIVRDPNHALFLTLADCVGAVIFDADKKILMLSHLGRHSIEQNGGYESIKFLVDNYSCDPSKLEIWLTPAPDKDVYPLFLFNNRSIKEVLFEQFVSAGIDIKNINDDPTDTTKDLNYYSHSEFLKGNREQDGRYAVVAMMKN